MRRTDEQGLVWVTVHNETTGGKAEVPMPAFEETYQNLGWVLDDDGADNHPAQFVQEVEEDPHG